MTSELSSDNNIYVEREKIMIDLHLHSDCSDGTMSPDEIVHEAVKRELYAISLTDHDTLDGVKQIKKSKDIEKIHFISGIEMSCEALKKEIHILGYGIDENQDAFNQKLECIREGRSHRNEDMIHMFQKDGFPITLEKLKHGNGDTVITRAHFARVLVEEGICKSKDEAFQKYLGDDCKYYLKKPFFDPKEAISMIQSAEGVAVLAHPFQYNFSNKQLEDLICEWKEYGLEGIEVYHSSHHIGQSSRLKEWCCKYALMSTGGSDYHGTNKPQIQMGIGYGGLKVPDSLYDVLKNRCI